MNNTGGVYPAFPTRGKTREALLSSGNDGHFSGIAFIIGVDEFDVGEIGSLAKLHTRRADMAVHQLTVFEIGYA